MYVIKVPLVCNGLSTKVLVKLFSPLPKLISMISVSVAPTVLTSFTSTSLLAVNVKFTETLILLFVCVVVIAVVFPGMSVYVVLVTAWLFVKFATCVVF